jgi:predicted ArsR family transcriptional regulator
MLIIGNLEYHWKCGEGINMAVKKETLYDQIQNMSTKILALLEKHGPLTSDEICNWLDYEKTSWGYKGQSTLLLRLKTLIRDSKIVRFLADGNNVGRPPVFYKLQEKYDWNGDEDE